MKAKIPHVFVVSLLCISSLACSLAQDLLSTVGLFASPTPVDALPLALDCQTWVANTAGLTRGETIPENLRSENPVRMDSDFDVSRYFSTLDRLSMEPGYILDYVYVFRGLGANPLLYARSEEQAPFTTYAEYAASLGATQPEEQDDIYSQHIRDYLDHVIVEDSPEGFLQLAVMTVMAGQFYLEWHSLYNDDVILCTYAQADEIVQGLSEGGSATPKELIPEVRKIDFNPSVNMGEDSVEVRVIIFTEWGGFIERRIRFSRNFPHQLIDVSDQTLIEYDCGIMF